MNPTELHLFDKREQSLLVATERDRLAALSEDELDDLLTRVRRARNKYTKLYRRQSATLVADHSTRAGTSTSNQRTKRKAEILETALARVSTALAVAARATARELKQERLAAAAAAKGSPRPSGGVTTSKSNTSKSNTSVDGKRPARGRAASKGRQASRKSSGARAQARRDQS